MKIEIREKTSSASKADGISKRSNFVGKAVTLFLMMKVINSVKCVLILNTKKWLKIR